MVLTGLLLATSILVTSLVAISVLRDALVDNTDQELRQSVTSVSTVLLDGLEALSPLPCRTPGICWMLRAM